MNVLNAMTRIVLTLVSYLTNAPINTPAVSVLGGNNEAISWTREFFLTLLGISLIAWMSALIHHLLFVL